MGFLCPLLNAYRHLSPALRTKLLAQQLRYRKTCMSQEHTPLHHDKSLAAKSAKLGQLIDKHAQQGELLENFEGENSKDSHKKSAGMRSLTATVAGVSAVLVVAGLAMAVIVATKLWGTPGEHGNWFNSFNSTSKKADVEGAERARGQMRNGPYTEVMLQDVIDHCVGNIHYDPDSLLVVNYVHPSKSSYLPALYKVPFEQAKASQKTGQAYKLLNIATEKQFGSPIDLKSAYLNPRTEEGSLAVNIDNNLGLAVDLLAPSYKAENFLSSPKGKFIKEQAYRWGFILRYPEGKEKETGMTAVPNKFRYVGVPHAEIITKENLCLDEYPEFLGENREYEISGYIVCRQRGPQFKIPYGAQEVNISPDNTGYYIISSQMFDNQQSETRSLLNFKLR